MHVTIVHVWVKPEQVPAFIAATRANHEAAIREPGNRRFDVLQEAQDATKFVLYEAYTDAAAAAAHKVTPHYLAWREAVADMMARPREGIVHQGMFPVA